MPKVKSYAAPWLSGRSAGAALFEPVQDAGSNAVVPFISPKRKLSTPSPRRTIVRRGTEVFVAVGREIRWGDLAWLKEKHHDRRPAVKLEHSPSSFDGDDGIGDEQNPAQGVRIIKTPAADDIRQLIVSPNGSLLAIVTTHTVHICIIPDSSHLSSNDTTPIKPKIWTLGPTTHVTSRSPVASAIWHPLGVNGSCLVTITSDAIVRLWELSVVDRWSFDSPTLSIDLKKLVDGTTVDQDFTASTSATSVSFSPDSVEMRVAAAAFASRGSGGWCPMTLWVAMREGDVYALCPLLPQRWSPPPTLIPSLSIAVVTKVAALEDDLDASEQAKLLAQQQLDWMGDVDSQDPVIADTPPGESPAEVYIRPARPGAVPRLQGPFSLRADPTSEDDLDSELTDILVIGKKTDTAELMMGEDGDDISLDDDDGDQEGLSLTVVCLLSTSGQSKAYLDTHGVEAQWLPARNKVRMGRRMVLTDSASLLAFQCMDTMSPVEVSDDAWPLFSRDVTSRYSFFVTHHAGIVHISLASWAIRLETDLDGDSEAGSDFRLGLLVNSQGTRDRLYIRPTADPASPLAASVVVRDPDVGYFLLTATPYEAVPLTFETPRDDLVLARHLTPMRDDFPAKPLSFYEPRPVYRPNPVFQQPSGLPTLLERLRTSRHRTVASQPVRLSPLTLQILTDTHQMLSEETHELGFAAAEVFRRCDALQAEMRQQIIKVGELRAKIDRIAGRDDAAAGPDGRPAESDNQQFHSRTARAYRRQQAITARLERMRVAVGHAGSARPLSDKERAFVDEVRTLQAEVLGLEPDEPARGRPRPVAAAPGGTPLSERLRDVETLRADLCAEAQRLRPAAPAQHPDAATADQSHQQPVLVADLRIPSDIRRAKLQQVLGLLDRESALVDAVSSRLERLQVNMAST